MKLFWIFLLFIKITTISSRLRMLKVECSSSNLTCANSYCRLRSISRENQTLSLGCSIQRNVTNPFVRRFYSNLNRILNFTLQFKFHWFYKYQSIGSQWRQVIKLDSLSVCKLFQNKSLKIPFFDGMLENYKFAFPSLPSECPVIKGEYFVTNITNGAYDRLIENVRRLNGFISDGTYKFFINVFSNKDSNIFTFSWVSEVTV